MTLIKCHKDDQWHFIHFKARYTVPRHTDLQDIKFSHLQTICHYWLRTGNLFWRLSPFFFLFSFSVFHFLPIFLSQGLQGIHIAQHKWTRTRTAATRTPAAATTAARTWARLSWGFSTHSPVHALVLWGGIPELRARLQPRYYPQLHKKHITIC